MVVGTLDFGNIGGRVGKSLIFCDVELFYLAEVIAPIGKAGLDAIGIVSGRTVLSEGIAASLTLLGDDSDCAFA